jgi:hypothetical protein
VLNIAPTFSDLKFIPDFPVKPYRGTKSVVISTVSWMGGKNPFLGWAYVAAAALFVLLAVVGTVRHLLKPRSVDSPNYRVQMISLNLFHYAGGWGTCRYFHGTDEAQ